MALTLHLRPHAVLQVLSRHVAGEVVENVAGLGGRRHAPEVAGTQGTGLPWGTQPVGDMVVTPSQRETHGVNNFQTCLNAGCGGLRGV